jgi:hypothetical protein
MVFGVQDPKTKQDDVSYSIAAMSSIVAGIDEYLISIPCTSQLLFTLL